MRSKSAALCCALCCAATLLFPGVTLAQLDSPDSPLIHLQGLCKDTCSKGSAGFGTGGGGSGGTGTGAGTGSAAAKVASWKACTDQTRSALAEKMPVPTSSCYTQATCAGSAFTAEPAPATKAAGGIGAGLRRQGGQGGF